MDDDGAWGRYLGVEPKIGVVKPVPPKSSHLFIGFSIKKDHPFWGTSIFLVQHPFKFCCGENFWSN